MDSRVETSVGSRPLTLEEALSGKRIPRAIRRSQVLLDVEHIGFDERAHDGQLVIRRDLQKNVAAIFAELYKIQFPIDKIIPISAFGWNDPLSMKKNNTVAFDYRPIAGTHRLSNHACGAIDVNPLQNPHIKDGRTTPSSGHYDPSQPGTLVKGGAALKIFQKHGFRTWGGDWTSLKDYMHVEPS